MTNIFISGGAGYLGSVLVPALLKRNHGIDRVTVLDHFAHNQNSLAACARYRNFEAVNGDARDMSIVAPLVAKADVVIPLAAIVGAPACKRDQSAAISTNRHAVANLCGLLSPEQRVIFPNTNSGYGIGGEDLCTEESPLRPLTLYGQTKAEAEQIVMDRENSIAFRLATVFGPSPRMRLDLLVNEFVWRAVNDKSITIFEGHFRRNFVHVSDVARAFCHAISEFGRMKGNIYNVGRTDANMTKLELCAKIKEYVSDFVYLEAPIGNDEDKRDYIVSNAKMEATGWAPIETIDDGIKELLVLYPMLRNSIYANV